MSNKIYVGFKTEDNSEYYAWYELQVPFETENMNDKELESFRMSIDGLYSLYNDTGNVNVIYDFELKDKGEL